MSVNHGGTLVARSNPIFPVVFIGKTPPRPAEDRDIDLSQSVNDIVSDSPRILDRTVIPYPESSINAPAKMFGKMAIDIFIDRIITQISVDYNTVVYLLILFIQGKNETNGYEQRQCQKR